MNIFPNPRITLIAAHAKNRAIGKDNQLLWHIPEDMAHFKSLTWGHSVLMGRKTWESLPERFRPLPGRENFVLTRNAQFLPKGAKTISSVENALKLASTVEKLLIIGGAEIYTAFLPHATSLELTEVDLEPAGDAFFPEIGPNWVCKNTQQLISRNGLVVRFATYQRQL